MSVTRQIEVKPMPTEHPRLQARMVRHRDHQCAGSSQDTTHLGEGFMRFGQMFQHMPDHHEIEESIAKSRVGQGAAMHMDPWSFFFCGKVAPLDSVAVASERFHCEQ